MNKTYIVFCWNDNLDTVCSVTGVTWQVIYLPNFRFCVPKIGLVVCIENKYEYFPPEIGKKTRVFAIVKSINITLEDKLVSCVKDNKQNV